jgi:hypothetical protein
MQEFHHNRITIEPPGDALLVTTSENASSAESE